ncbi:MAG: hypothetical protein LBS41_00105 [Streptococcaceae bacterium]|jgi:flagellar basal body-associated protein FliL|nr:hypothetical protein [Streptococcaceae bacterium]
MKRKQPKKKVGIIFALLIVIVAAIAIVLVLKPFNKKETAAGPIKVDPAKSAAQSYNFGKILIKNGNFQDNRQI